MGSKKTPVTILHEYCIMRKEIPKYELIAEERTNNMDMNFTFGIDLFNEYATGSGPNKKAAKHEAALALLQSLAEKDNALLKFLRSNGLGDDIPIETPYINHNLENYVGKLENLILINNLPSPVYKQRYEEGMSHDKTFTWTCRLGKLYVEESHRTKKQAKHTVAMLMIEILEKELGDDFISTIPEDFRVDYKEDDFCVERRKVRAHLLGCKVLAQSTARFSPVVISKLHRVITEPHLEVACTMEDIRGELGMTPDQFNEFLDCENLATLDKLCDILNKLSTDTDIDIQFFTLDFNQDIDNDQSSPIVSEAQERVPEESHIASSDSNINVNENENLASEKLGLSVHNLKINNQSFPIDNETQEIGPEPSNNISSVPDININESTSSTVVSRGDTSDLKDRTSDSDMTERSPDININESTSSTVVSRGDTSDLKDRTSDSDMTERSPDININESTSSTVVSRGDTSDLKDRTSDSDMTERSPDININESTSSTVVSRGDTSDLKDRTSDSDMTERSPDININESTSITVVSRGDTSDLKDRTSDSDMTESSPDININESTSSTVVSRGDTSDLKDRTTDSSDMTESSPETEQASAPLIFVMCKVLIRPPMHFLGKSSSYEESKRKAAILFLKHVNSLKTDRLRKRHFIENFSSGDEAEC